MKEEAKKKTLMEIVDEKIANAKPSDPNYPNLEKIRDWLIESRKTNNKIGK